MPEPPPGVAENVLDWPTANVVVPGEIVTVRAVFTITEVAVDVTVTGVLALSVTWSSKLQDPVVVEAEVINE